MTIEEILAALKADANYDALTAINTVINESVTKLAHKNTELLGKLATAKTKADGIPEEFTPERWTELVDLEGKVDLAKLNGDEKIEALKLSLETQHTGIVDSLKTKVMRLDSALHRELIDNAALAALSASEANAPLLLPHFKTSLKVVESDEGEYSTVVVDASGNERYSLVNAGEKMKMAELVGEFKQNPVYAPAFKATNGGGGGEGGNGGEGNNPFDKKGGHFSYTEQAKMMQTNPALGKQLKDQAANAAAS